MSLLQGTRREWVDIHKGQEIGRKEGKRRLGMYWGIFLLIAVKSVRIASHPAVLFTRRLARVSPCPPWLAHTHTFMHATSHVSVHASMQYPSPPKHTYTHTSKSLLHPPPGFSPVYPGIQARPWPDWGADRGFLWCWVSCVALSASNPALGHKLL